MTTNNEFNGYDLQITLNEEQLWSYHRVLDHAYRTWPGGPPEDQEMLYCLKTKAEALILEIQFMKS